MPLLLKTTLKSSSYAKLISMRPHGTVRLIVESIDPTYTLGKLAQEKQRLIALFAKKGILSRNKRLELPLVPLRIGLITAFDSAAYE